MKKMNRILVAHDLSTTSDNALAFALRLAQKKEAGLHVLSVDVVQDDLHNMLIRRHQPDTHLDEVAEKLRKESQRFLDEMGIASSEIAIEPRAVRAASPAPAIVQYAQEQDIDLIVTGTYGRKGVQRALLGSVASEVLRTAARPVLTVRSGPRKPPVNVHKVLVPVDFSEPSEGALRYGAGLAELFGARVHALHVIEDVNSEEIYGFKPSIFGASEGYKYVRERLKKLIARLPVQATPHVLTGRPADEITDFASQKNVDLIVMPTRGQIGLQRLLMGSVAETVIRSATCPVVSARDFKPYLLPEKTAASR